MPPIVHRHATTLAAPIMSTVTLATAHRLLPKHRRTNSCTCTLGPGWTCYRAKNLGEKEKVSEINSKFSGPSLLEREPRGPHEVHHC